MTMLAPQRLDPRRQGDTFRPDTIRWVLTDDDFSELLLAIEHSSEVVVDLETTGLDEYATFGGATNGGYPARIVLASFTLPQENEEGAEPTTYVLPLSHPDSPWLGSWRRTLGLAAEKIKSSARPVVNANAKFDVKWIYAHTRVDLSALIVWDTQVSSHLLDETESTRLKERVPATFGVGRWDDFDLSKPGAAERVPLFDLGAYACIAEGQEVLTHRGLVPIEDVTLDHQLWDGVEWVTHDGVICKGTQHVLRLDNGLEATPDHLILTSAGDYVCAASIARGERRAATSSDESARGGLLDPDWKDMERASSSVGGGLLLPVRKDVRQEGERSSAGDVGVPVPVGGKVRTRSSGEGPERSISRDGAALFPRRAHSTKSRGPGDLDQSGVLDLREVHSMGAGESSSPDVQRDHARSDQQLRGLRTGEPEVGGLHRAGSEHLSHRACGVHGADGCPGSSVAFGQDRPTGFSSVEGRVGTPDAARDERGRSAQFPCQEKVVYDILNAGPRHRFQVSGVIVSNCRDTYWTWRLYELHIWLMNISEPEEPDDPDALELARIGRLATYVAMPTVRSLTAIEQRGFRLDVDWVREHLAECQDTSRALIDKLATRYGLDPATASFAPTSKWFISWTEAALAAGDLIVGGLTATGRPQWDKAVLVRQSRAGLDVATDLLELRSAVKQAEYLTSWLGQVTPEGKIHTTYHAGRVVTGRLSSSEPNMQQVTKVLKPAFIPRAGNVIAELDFSQIELRVAAFISRCEPMLEAFRQGQDLHRLLGAKLTGKAPEDVTDKERQAAKSANFGLLYQMSAAGFQTYAETVYGVAFTADEAAAVRQAFYDMWDGIGAWHLRSIRKARMTGQVVSPIGRVRRLPDINSYNDRLVGWSERSAVNSPVQGFASDLMQLAAAWIGGLAPGHAPVWDAEIVATVHDSIVIEAPADRWESVVRECMDRMVRVGELLTELDCHLDVPLAVEAKVGSRWGLGDIGTVES